MSKKRNALFPVEVETGITVKADAYLCPQLFGLVYSGASIRSPWRSEVFNEGSDRDARYHALIDAGYEVRAFNIPEETDEQRDQVSLAQARDIVAAADVPIDATPVAETPQ